MISLLKAQEQVLHLADLKSISNTLQTPLQFDIRYAREDNFIKKQVYSKPEAFLLSHVAEDLLKVHLDLNKKGFGLLIYDGYRPWSVTKLFWDQSSPHDRQFLADPAKGSSHNRGCAVDLSMYEIKTGNAVVMPSDFDEMNEKAYVAYAGGTASERACRDLLQAAMKAHRFTGIKNEWWHFNHQSHHEYPVMNFSFAEILQAPKSQHPLRVG